ncbi:MAG: Gfo/Idh/MocA family oxidoreductase [Planctomycetota bacterium]|nr:Gfo/Idh/MocA family oxidoreductase [Planctomycetota bacterium]
MSRNSGAKQRAGATLGRRDFLAAAGAAAVSVTILSPKTVRGAEANSKIELGLIGCGGRGNWIADLFTKHGGFKFVAGADYFEDKAKGFGDRLQIEASRRYSGLNGYKKLLEGKLDAVVVESPPFFHPEHAAAGAEAGKHVYVAKPIAVDVPGCLLHAEAGKKATEKKLVYLVDFQTRANALYQEAIKRVHNGDLGKLVNGEAVYYCGDTWGNPDYNNTNAEERLRHWGVDKVLSGDIITEQNIHALDVATWVIDEAPLRAIGSYGRKARSGSGDVNDHFGAVYNFPNDVVLMFSSKQYGQGYDDIGCRMFGARGTIDTHYGGGVSIRGAVAYKGGNTGNIFTDGVVTNIATFHDCITNKKFENTTVAPSVRSNLTTVLGRTACYKGTAVTWDEMMKANEKLEFDMKALKA